MELTKKRQAEIQAYVDELQPILRLTDWKIDVRTDHIENDSILASITCTYGQRHANLRVSDDFGDHSLVDQRIALVHELLHCHLNRIRVSALNTFTRLGHDAYEVAKAQIGDEIEYATDAIAQALAPLCPLPPWGN